MRWETVSIEEYVDALVVRRRRLRLRAVTPIEIPAFAGALWHAALGPALKRVGCVRRSPEPCSRCPGEPACPYALVMEAVPQGGDGAPMGRLARVPGPLALDPGPWRGRRLDRGQELTVGFALVGHDIGLVDAVTRALSMAADEGLGRDRGRARLEGYVHDEHPCAVSDALPDGGTVLRLLTPLRLVRKGQPMREFDLVALTNDLARRVAALGHYHSGLPWPAPWREVMTEAASARAAPLRLRWIEGRRYSARQARTIAVGGLVGEIALDDVGPRLGRLLQAGTVLHAGKGTSMGLGQLALLPVAPSGRM